MPRRKVPITARPRTTIRPIPEHSGFTSSSSSSSEALASNGLSAITEPNESRLPVAPAPRKTSLPIVSGPEDRATNPSSVLSDAAPDESSLSTVLPAPDCPGWSTYAVPNAHTSSLSNHSTPDELSSSTVSAPKDPATDHQYSVPDFAAPDGPVFTNVPAPHHLGLSDVPESNEPELFNAPASDEPGFSDVPASKEHSLSNISTPKGDASTLSSAPDVAAQDQPNLSTVGPAPNVPGLFSNSAPDAPRLFSNPPQDDPSSFRVSAQTDPTTSQSSVPSVAAPAEHSVFTVPAPEFPFVPAPNEPVSIYVPALYEPSLTSVAAPNLPVLPAASDPGSTNISASHEPSLPIIPASNGPLQDTNTNAFEPLNGDIRPIQPSSFRLAPILELFVADYLLPYNHRREALNVARTCRAHFEMLAPLVYRTWVWYERDGEDVWDRTERWESFMENFPRIDLVRHLVVGSHELARELGDDFRQREGARLLSTTSWDEHFINVQFCAPAPKPCLFRILPETAAATWYASSRGRREEVDPTTRWFDSVTVYTHFDRSSAWPGFPSSSSRDLLAAQVEEGIVEEGVIAALEPDEMFERTAPTDFGNIRYIVLKPEWRMTYNAFPYLTIVGLAQALSMQNARNQSLFCEKGERKPEVRLNLCHYGEWRELHNMVDLIDSLCATRNPTINLKLGIQMRCASDELRPGLAEMEEVASKIVGPYCAFVYNLLHPWNDIEAALRRPLVGEVCNPEILIEITHVDFPGSRTIKLEPTTDGETVDVLYDSYPPDEEIGSAFSQWGWQPSEDGQNMDCVQLS